VHQKAATFPNLDGLRGLAALSVVLWHYSLAFFPALNNRSATHPLAFGQLVATTPLHLPLAGDFAVSVFFVLSGFVLSLSFFRSRSTSVLMSAAARRYFRLMLPALGSILLACLLIWLGLMHNGQAAALTGSEGWLGRYWDFPANIFVALYQGLYAIFFTDFNSYNPVLWTMKLELLGSFMVFALLALFGRMRRRWIVYAVLGGLLLTTHFLPFIAGVAIADIWVNRSSWQARLSPPVSTALLVTGLLLGSVYISNYPNMYQRLQVGFIPDWQLTILLHSIGAVAVVLAVLRLGWLSRFMKTRPLQFLGRISFSMYLLHFIIMGSLGSLLFATLFPAFSFIASFIVTFIVSMTATLVAAALYTRYVDQPSIVLSKYLGNKMIGAQPQPQPMPAQSPAHMEAGKYPTINLAGKADA
jgi:peptidoglycan/LPS O-acetylase OafA/YrhL